jgi:phosphoglycolate phosphatase
MATIIFDFDGTIADSQDYFIDFIAKEAKLPPLTDQERRALYGLSLARVSRRLGHPWWRLPRLYYKGRSHMYPVINNSRPFVGMPRVIKKLHAEGHELFILSSNSVRNMHKFLHHRHLHRYFLEIYGGVGLFGKAAALRQLLREHELEMADAVYVGDELRDMEAAGSIGLRAVAVTWGFAARRHLKASGPMAMADTPAELMRILEEL